MLEVLIIENAFWLKVSDIILWNLVCICCHNFSREALLEIYKYQSPTFKSDFQQNPENNTLW